MGEKPIESLGRPRGSVRAYLAIWIGIVLTFFYNILSFIVWVGSGDVTLLTTALGADILMAKSVMDAYFKLRDDEITLEQQRLLGKEEE